MATATEPRPPRQPKSSLGVKASADAELDYKPSYLAAGVVALVIFALYIITLSPSTAMWDTSEYIAAAYTLGLPHPPGNPLFVLIGRVFAVLPIAPNVAMRINVLAALCSAGSAAMWFLITERVLVGWLPLSVRYSTRPFCTRISSSPSTLPDQCNASCSERPY